MKTRKQHSRWARYGAAAIIGGLLLILAIGGLATLAVNLVGSGGSRTISTAQVEDLMRAGRDRGRVVTDTRCDVVAHDTWNCVVRLDGGELLNERATWYQWSKSLGVSLVGGSAKVRRVP